MFLKVGVPQNQWFPETTDVGCFLALRSRAARQQRFERAAQQLLSKAVTLKQRAVAAKAWLVDDCRDYPALGLLQ